MSTEIDPAPTHAFGLWGIDRDSPYRAMLLDFIERQAQELAEGLAKPETSERGEARRAELKPRLLHSGGGLNTFYTSAVDERIKVSVPVCYITTFFSMMTAERDRNWEDGVDLCNQVPGVMAYAEMSDICGLFAPKPLCIIAGVRDWMFPIEGVRKVYKDIAHIYHLLKASDRVRLAEVDSEHGYDRQMREGVFAERVVFESEPGIVIPVMFAAPAHWAEYVPVVVYVDEWGKATGLKNGVIDALLKAGLAVFAIDVRGVGETATTDFEATTNALMTDRPLFGQRVYDVLRAVDCLWRRIYISVRIDKGRIACLGRGAGGLLALYAATLDKRLAATAMWEAPVSYKTLITERPGFPPSVYPFDVLNHFDLPSLMATLAPQPLLLAHPLDGRRRRITTEEVEGHCQQPRQAFASSQAGPHGFQVFGDPTEPVPLGAIAGWLKENV